MGHKSGWAGADVMSQHWQSVQHYLCQLLHRLKPVQRSSGLLRSDDLLPFLEVLKPCLAYHDREEVGFASGKPLPGDSCTDSDQCLSP